mgnify:CR=1 FL=1
MAKKQKAEVAVEEPIVVTPPKKQDITPRWEIKDRVYELRSSKTPIVYILKSRGLLWFDEELGYEREIKYCENQKTVFQDEMVKHL